MTLEEAIKIVDPATRREALYIYDPEERKGVEDEACHLVANKLQQLSKADQDGRQPIPKKEKKMPEYTTLTEKQKEISC